MGTCGFLLGVLRRTYFSHISLYVEEDLLGQILLQELMVQPMQYYTEAITMASHPVT